MLYILVEETLRTEFNLCKVKSLTNNGVGRIRTGELQRPRLASYQARQRPPLFLLFIFFGFNFKFRKIINHYDTTSIKNDSFLTGVTTCNNFCKSFMRDYSMFRLRNHHLLSFNQCWISMNVLFLFKDV